MRKAMKFLPLLAVLCSLALTGGQQTPRTEQRHFRSFEVKMTLPVELPSEVRAALQKDEDVLRGLAAAKLPPNKLPASWFTASTIHTEGGGELLVVEAVRPLYNEYETKFWIFDLAPTGYQLVLDDVGRELEVASSGTHPAIHVTHDHYEIYPSTSYHWKDDHYAVIVVK